MTAPLDGAAATLPVVGRRVAAARLAVGLVLWVAGNPVGAHCTVADVSVVWVGVGNGSGESGGKASDKEEGNGEAHFGGLVGRLTGWGLEWLVGIIRRVRREDCRNRMLCCWMVRAVVM